jgi:hypothetical protein
MVSQATAEFDGAEITAEEFDPVRAEAWEWFDEQ